MYYIELLHRTISSTNLGRGREGQGLSWRAGQFPNLVNSDIINADGSEIQE
jgi:hypothetical protein